MTVADFVDFKSFWSVWYWIFSIVTWSISSHWTLGVPFDMVIRAERKGGVFADQCEALIQINMQRLIYYFDLGGAFIVGFMSFFLAVIATLGFVLGLEIFIAIFMLAFPITIVTAFGVRFAYIATRLGWEGPVLRKKLRRRRTYNQIIGMIATIAAVIMAGYFYLSTINLYW